MKAMVSDNIEYFTYDLHLPEYPTEEIVLDPNFGNNDLVYLWAVDEARAATGSDDLLDGYRSRFYHVTSPAGSLAGLDAILYSLSDPGDGVGGREGPPVRLGPNQP
jgi:hypothetical protein